MQVQFVSLSWNIVLTWLRLSTYVGSVGSFGVRIFKCPNFELYKVKVVSPYTVFASLISLLFLSMCKIRSSMTLEKTFEKSNGCQEDKPKGRINYFPGPH